MDLINYALSFEFITGAYIPFIVKSFFGLFAVAFAIILSIIFYAIFEKTILGNGILYITTILLVLISMLISLFLLLILGLPILLSVISIRIYIIGILPNMPLLGTVIAAFAVVALTATIIQIIKSNIL